ISIREPSASRTAPYITRARGPTSTSPTRAAVGATYAVGWTRGSFPRCRIRMPSIRAFMVLPFPELQTSDLHLCRMLDREPVPCSRRPSGLQRGFRGQFAQVGLLGRAGARLPEPALDTPVGRDRIVVMPADPGGARGVVAYGRPVGDVHSTGTANDR